MAIKRAVRQQSWDTIPVGDARPKQTCDWKAPLLAGIHLQTVRAACCFLLLLLLLLLER